MIGREDTVARDDDANGKTRANGQRRLDIKIAADDLLASLVETLRAATTQRLNVAGPRRVIHVEC